MLHWEGKLKATDSQVLANATLNLGCGVEEIDLQKNALQVPETFLLSFVAGI